MPDLIDRGCDLNIGIKKKKKKDPSPGDLIVLQSFGTTDAMSGYPTFS